MLFFDDTTALRATGLLYLALQITPTYYVFTFEFPCGCVNETTSRVLHLSNVGGGVLEQEQRRNGRYGDGRSEFTLPLEMCCRSFCTFKPSSKDPGFCRILSSLSAGLQLTATRILRTWQGLSTLARSASNGFVCSTGKDELVTASRRCCT